MVTDKQFKQMQDTVGNLAGIVENLANSVASQQKTRIEEQTESAKMYYAEQPKERDVPEMNMGRTYVNSPKWTFEDMVKKHAKSLSVDKPFKSAFVLRMAHIGCDKHPTKELSQAYRKAHRESCPECYEQWKALARAGKYTSTTRFGNSYTTFIKLKYEENVFKILKAHGVEIPTLTKEEQKTREAILVEKRKEKAKRASSNVGTERS